MWYIENTKNYIFINYLKAIKYNIYAYQESIYKYVTKKYYIICLIKKNKYLNCKDLPSKYTSNNMFFYNIDDILLSNDFKLLY